MVAPTLTFVASDLDGTLIPGEGTALHSGGVRDFTQAVEEARGTLALAYVTGRHRELALAGVEEWKLPHPDFLVCDVGTTVYRWDGEAFQEDQAYAREMARALGGADADTLRQALAGQELLTLQEARRQGRFKASFTFPWHRRAQVEDATRVALAAAGAQAELVVSRDLNGVGLLDLLPRGGAKDRALSHLARLLGISLEEAVFAGDSGNDVRALLCGVRGILVGNATEDVRAHIREETRRCQRPGQVYFASRPVAAGVLEGLRHWGAVPGPTRL